MEPFVTLTAIAAPLREADVDTDVIFPARFMLGPDKKGLGRHLFHERRTRAPADAPFVLDRPPWDRARILVAGRNFGTGSSREHAVWALADFGIRCVIAPQFGEIFFSNCFRNGVLPVVVGPDDHARLMAEAEAGRPLTVDLPAEEVRPAAGPPVRIPIEPHRKRALVEGLDEIGMILADDLAGIEAFETRHRLAQPWLFLGPDQLAHFDDVRAIPAQE